MSDISFDNLIGVPGLTAPSPIDDNNPNNLDFSQFLDNELTGKKRSFYQ